MMDLDLDHLRGWIGSKEIKSEAVTPALVERFNTTFGRTGDTAPGAPAPVMIHLCLAPPAAPIDQLGPDGHPARGGFLPPVPLPRRMWAGGSFSFHDDIRIGETVTRRSTIRDVAVKQGRTGPLCFVTVEHRIESDSRHVLTERQDIVYRDLDAASSPPKAPPPPAPEGTHRITVEPTAPLLFRYSALTFNGHRIHYDAPYTREVEGYPGLIVHGPLQASQLVHLAEKTRGHVPKTFDFRSLSTIFDTADYSLNATADGEALNLWTAQADGPVAMQARASW
ncbi:MaoC family dehydratase N-terminal domain-containing protein [Paracoccus sp. MC1854]|uniref:FAS1-like dehydratase domain-containing protein n=1 Tax=Paracoccus sp. MC1854 TaxID=2760306 RepID=UPI002104A749|nr:MaoC family dehydratase N-terminal domain-containing protein [Paracoccus sp. MC1854]